MLGELPVSCIRGPLLILFRDHVELPDDFAERAEVIMERHRATPVKEEIRGELLRPPLRRGRDIADNSRRL